MFSRTDIPRKESEEVGEHILTKAVKAGRRTYFFDVRATRGNDYYLPGDAAVPHGGLHSAGTRVVSPSSEKGGAAGVRREEG